ncbi:MAG: hypothetical protein GX166_08670 [Clostridiaceae bacterium]|nr:hypothetical protein [Clostridiaceae bacterium]
MKDKFYYNFVNSLIAVGILSIPVSILVYILFEKGVVVTYFNNFVVLVIGVVVCILSFVLHFVLSKTYGYKKVMWKYKEENEIELPFDNLSEGFGKSLKDLGFHVVSLPDLIDVFVLEEPLKDGLYIKAAFCVKEEEFDLKKVRNVENTLTRYYFDNDMAIKAITGICCVVLDEVTKRKVEKYKQVKDYFNYNEPKDVVVQIAFCAADLHSKKIYFNSENITGKRNIPILLINDIFRR